jgi:hypothetical protein
MAASTEDDEPSLCAKCIGNARFAKWISENGSKGKCDFGKTHGRSNAFVMVEAFAVEVDRYFRENYQRGEELPHVYEDSDKVWYEVEGEPYKDILANDLECDEDVINGCVARPKADFRGSSAGPIRAAPCRSAVALPVGATSNASSRESRLCANARGFRAE